jgi:hypothetical protein
MSDKPDIFSEQDGRLLSASRDTPKVKSLQKETREYSP